MFLLCRACNSSVGAEQQCLPRGWGAWGFRLSFYPHRMGLLSLVTVACDVLFLAVTPYFILDTTMGLCIEYNSSFFERIKESKSGFMTCLAHFCCSLNLSLYVFHVSVFWWVELIKFCYLSLLVLAHIASDVVQYMSFRQRQRRMPRFLVYVHLLARLGELRVRHLS